MDEGACSLVRLQLRAGRKQQRSETSWGGGTPRSSKGAGCTTWTHGAADLERRVRIIAIPTLPKLSEGGYRTDVEQLAHEEEWVWSMRLRWSGLAGWPIWALVLFIDSQRIAAKAMQLFGVMFDLKSNLPISDVVVQIGDIVLLDFEKIAAATMTASNAASATRMLNTRGVSSFND